MLKLNNGGDPALSTADPESIKILHRAQFKFGCPEWCDGSRRRKYFHILENSYEQNHPVACPCLPCIPPNWMCPGYDCISKQYFDRGAYDQQNICHRSGCCSGAPSMYGGARKHMICCCAAPESLDNCCDCMCCDFGESVRVIPCETCFCCCPNRVKCGCGCGLKTGEPICVFPFLRNLEVGEAKRAAEAFNVARTQWSSRTGIE